MVIVSWVQAHMALIAEVLGVIVALDTALAEIPSVAANSSFQALTKALKWLKSVIVSPPAA